MFWQYVQVEWEAIFGLVILDLDFGSEMYLSFYLKKGVGHKLGPMIKISEPDAIGLFCPGFVNPRWLIYVIGRMMETLLHFETPDNYKLPDIESPVS